MGDCGTHNMFTSRCFVWYICMKDGGACLEHILLTREAIIL